MEVGNYFGIAKTKTEISTAKFDQTVSNWYDKDNKTYNKVLEPLVVEHHVEVHMGVEDQKKQSPIMKQLQKEQKYFNNDCFYALIKHKVLQMKTLPTTALTKSVDDHCCIWNSTYKLMEYPSK